MPTTPSRRLTALTLGVILVLVVLVVAMGGRHSSVMRRLGLAHERVVPEITTRGEHRFTQTQAGTGDPVGWDPCREIDYRVNLAQAPSDGRELVHSAIGRLSEATMLRFRDRGTTDQAPFDDHLPLLSRRGGVVIGWATPAELPEIAGRAGLAGSTTHAVRGRLFYNAGAVALDVDTFADGRTPDSIRRSIILHELAHVVGLDHVHEPLELMFAETTGSIDFGPGDLEGLARLGRIPCA